MKSLILVINFCLFSNFIYANSSNEIKSIELDRSSDNNLQNKTFGFYASLLGPEIGLAAQFDIFITKYFSTSFRLGGMIQEGTGVDDELILKKAYSLGLNYSYFLNENNAILLGPGLMCAKNEYLPYFHLTYEHTLDVGISFRFSAYTHLKREYAVEYEKIIPFIPSISVGFKL